MHIAIVIPHFGAGGAERVASLLCNCWASLGHSVTAITFEAPGIESFFALDAVVERRQLNGLNCKASAFRRVVTNLRRVWRVRSALKAIGPDIVVAFMIEASVVTVCAAAGLGLPVVVTERNQPHRQGLGRFRRIARRLTYRWASAIIVQTSDIARWARSRFPVPVYVLPNPVTNSHIREHRDTPLTKLAVSVGRLAHQKGFDLLIESFARVAAKHPSWRLVIYGEGPARRELQAQIDRWGISDRTCLAGLFTDLGSAIGAADLFVSASRFEGYPNALLEALSFGCPVIATDCPGATAEILDGGHYGLLVPPEKVEALTEALHRMMSDADLRARYSKRAPEAVSHLGRVAIARRWLEIFSSLKARPRVPRPSRRRMRANL